MKLELGRVYSVSIKIAVLAAFSLFSSKAVSSAATENDALVLFDAICISTDADINVIEKMAAAYKAKPIPKEALEADQAIARNGGKGYIMRINKSKLAVMVTLKRSCAVMAQNISPEIMKNILLKNYPLSKEGEDSSGTQIMTIYRLIPPSRYSGGVIVLNITKPGFGADNSASFGFFPAESIGR